MKIVGNIYLPSPTTVFLPPPVPYRDDGHGDRRPRLTHARRRPVAWHARRLGGGGEGGRRRGPEAPAGRLARSRSVRQVGEPFLGGHAAMEGGSAPWPLGGRELCSEPRKQRFSGQNP